jgi:hypothetical protein
MPNKGKMSDYLTDMLLYSEERAKRGWTIQSQFRNAGYIAKGKSIIFVAGKNGTLALDLDCIEEFCKELLEVKEIVELRKRAGIQ